MKEISLGTKYDGPQCCPQTTSGEQVSYPGTYITVPAGTEIPQSGIITFRYKLTGARTAEKMSKVSLDLELTDIVDCSDGKNEGIPSAEQALAKYISRMAGHDSEAEDD